MSEAIGEVEKEDNVLVLKRIHVTYYLKVSPDKRAVAERVHGFHADYCPVARSIRNCVSISTSLVMEDVPEDAG